MDGNFPFIFIMFLILLPYFLTSFNSQPETLMEQHQFAPAKDVAHHIKYFPAWASLWINN